MRQFIWLLVCLFNLSLVSAQEVRTWTDVDGRKMQAQFVREVDGDVTFIKDGKLITFPLDRLSDDDQKHIREAETGKKVEEAATPAGAPRKEASADTSLSPSDSGSTSESKTSLTKERTDAETRTWRDFRGRQTVGKFVRMHQDNVVVLSGARAVSIPYYSLSRPDREYLRELLTALGEAAQLPFSPSAEPDAPAEPQPGAGAEPIAPPEAPTAPTRGGAPPVGRGGGGSDANDRLAKMHEENRQRMAESNERLAKMQEESRQRLAEASERREKAAQRTAEMAQRSLQRLQPGNPSQQESPNDLVGTCSNCKNSITREQISGMKCPHCGVIWEYEVDEFGRKKEIPGAAAAIAAAGTNGQSTTRTGWEMEPRHYRKLFTRIIIPIAVMLFAAIAAVVRGR